MRSYHLGATANRGPDQDFHKLTRARPTVSGWAFYTLGDAFYGGVDVKARDVQGRLYQVELSLAVTRSS